MMLRLEIGSPYGVFVCRQKSRIFYGEFVEIVYQVILIFNIGVFMSIYLGYFVIRRLKIHDTSLSLALFALSCWRYVNLLSLIESCTSKTDGFLNQFFQVLRMSSIQEICKFSMVLWGI